MSLPTKNVIMGLLAVFLSVSAFAENNVIDWDNFIHETVTLRCNSTDNHAVLDYSSSFDGLNLTGTCAKAISDIKSIAEHPIEYLKLKMLPATFGTYYLIEYLRKKPPLDTQYAVSIDVD